MGTSGAEAYKKLVIEIGVLLEETRGINGSFVSKTLIVGEREMETLKSGYLGMVAGSSTFFFRGIPIKELPIDNHLGIEIESTSRMGEE